MNYKIEDLIAEYKKKKVYISPRLLRAKNITEPKQIKALVNSHVEKLKVIELMDLTDDIVELHNLAKKIEKIEFKQQKLWGFQQNPDYHHWWKVPKCICPSMDNDDNYGTKYRIVNSKCPVHGNIKSEKKKRTFWSKWW